ncbi:hypothetical protein AB0M47_07465 [Hamadaea sp. NPDC051192]|uniref:WXG100 family type VII secretion target n=1 Tax=Hamadaea sp. NPDC051192 TaxID=3154940 RepID=UPI00342693BC
MFEDPPGGTSEPETVKVDPADIEAYAKMFDAADDENEGNRKSAASCVVQQPQPLENYTGKRIMHKGDSTFVSCTPESGHLLATIKVASDGLTAALGDFLGVLHGVLAEAGPTLNRVAAAYVRADQDSADAVAQADPDAVILAEPYYDGQSAHAFEYAVPEDDYLRLDNTLYGDPDPYAEIKAASDGVRSLTGGPSLLDRVTSWNWEFDFVNEEAAGPVKAFLSGYGIGVDGMTEKFTGDWHDLRVCSSGLRRVAIGLASISRNVTQGMTDLRVTWSGEAADQAEAYFSELSARALQPVEALTSSAQAIDDAFAAVADRVPTMAFWIQATMYLGSWAMAATDSSDYGNAKDGVTGGGKGIAISKLYDLAAFDYCLGEALHIWHNSVKVSHGHCLDDATTCATSLTSLADAVREQTGALRTLRLGRTGGTT